MGRRWKDSDREDFLDDLVSENEEELQTQRVTSPLQQQVPGGFKPGLASNLHDVPLESHFMASYQPFAHDL